MHRKYSMFSKYKIFPKVVIILCLISILGVGYYSEIIKNNISELHEKKVLESLSGILVSTHRNLDNLAEDLKDISKAISKDRQFQKLVTSVLKHNNTKDIHKINSILTQLTITNKFLETSVISKDMTFIANSTIQKIGSKGVLNKMSSALVKLNQGHSIITPIEKSVDYFYNQDGEKEKSVPKFCIISPIINNQEVIAYLVISANPLDKFLKIFKTGRFAKTGETYAIREDGLMASETRFLIELKNTDPAITTSVLRNKVIDPDSRELTLMASSVTKRNSSSNLQGYPDYRGVNVIGSWSWNEHFSIGVTTEQDYNEAFSGVQLSHEFIDKFSITLLIAFLILSIVFIYNSKLTKESQSVLIRFNDGLKQEVTQGIRETEEANKAKNKFFSQISHEIRTPMNAIIGYSELLEQSHLTEDQIENLRQISESGKFLLQLINEILDFAKIDSGEFALEESPFNLKRTSESIVDLLRYKKTDLNLQLKLEIDPELSDHFVGDSHRIKQVIMNLTSNALKFTPEGEITVSLKRTKTDLNIEWVEISVTDTGIGIPASEIDRIFNDFTQADSSNTKLYGGSGLGLSISKKVVEAMGGEIGVNSTIGIGSKFWFKVPLITTNSIVTNEVSLNYDKSAIENLNVLVAEDNGVNLRLAIKLLTLVGFKNIESVTDGVDAVNFVKDNKVDIVFMDVMMPRLDGMDATRKIRSLGFKPNNLKIIALTANAFTEDRAECIKAGMNEHIKKPFKRADVVACLKQLNIC